MSWLTHLRDTARYAYNPHHKFSHVPPIADPGIDLLDSVAESC